MRLYRTPALAVLLATTTTTGFDPKADIARHVVLAYLRTAYMRLIGHGAAVTRITKRGMIVTGLASLLVGCMRSRAAKNVDLVQPYSPALERALFPQELPFLALYRRGQRTLGFAAVVHSSDPSSKTFGLISAAFTKLRPRSVILEGFPTMWGSNPKKIVEKVGQPASGSYDLGEDMHAARLAVQSGAKVWGGEPTTSELAAHLTQLGFSREDIFFASLLGPLAQDLEARVFSSPADPRFTVAYDRWAKLDAPQYGMTSPPEPQAFREWFRRNYGRTLEADTEWHTRGGPGQAGKAGEIGRAANLQRDRRLFELATRLAQTNGPVLIVYGGSHLASLWRAFQASLGSPTISA